MPGTRRVSSGPSVTVKEVPSGSPLREGEVGTISKILGSGSYGEVYLCEFGSQAFLAKHSKSLAQEPMTRAEYDVLLMLNGADGYVPRALGLGTIAKDAVSRDVLIEELCEGKTLRQIVERQWRGREPDVTAAEVALMGIAIATAVNAIGKHGVRHGDLSYTNVLLRPDSGGMWHCSLIDFGQAASTARPGVTVNREGTVAFSAAEMFAGSEFSRFKDRVSADAYSVGALMFYMRTWGRFEDRVPGSYFGEFTAGDGKSAAIDDLKRKPLDLTETLRELGAEGGVGDLELARLIRDLTEFDPRLRPGMSECVDRLARIAGVGSVSLGLHQHMRTVLRGVKRHVARAMLALRRVKKVTMRLLVVYAALMLLLTFLIGFVLPAIIERNSSDVDDSTALWHMTDDFFRSDDQDALNSDTPGLREHKPNLSGGHIDVTSFGAMTAYYDSDKYIVSDGQDPYGRIAYTDTREALVLPFRDEWHQVIQPIVWGENLLQTQVSARGGSEHLSYRYITPRPDYELRTLEEYLTDVTWADAAVGSTDAAGIDFSYKAGVVADSFHDGAPVAKAVTCYSQRSETCILEARIMLYADAGVLEKVSYDDLLDDLLGSIEVRSTNLGAVSASSPYSDLVIISQDGKWQAIVKEDEDYKPYVRRAKEWYYHAVSACTAMEYSESFEYDFAPTMGKDAWLAQEDRGLTGAVDEGEVPASDGISIHWSIAGVGDESGRMNLRVYVQVGESALCIQGIVPASTDGREAVRHLLLGTVEISKNQRPLVQVTD